MNIFTWFRILYLSQYQVSWFKSIIEVDIEQAQGTSDLEKQNKILGDYL